MFILTLLSCILTAVALTAFIYTTVAFYLPWHVATGNMPSASNIQNATPRLTRGLLQLIVGIGRK